MRFLLRKAQAAMLNRGHSYLINKITHADDYGEFDFYNYCAFKNILVKMDGSTDVMRSGASIRPETKVIRGCIVMGCETLEEAKNDAKLFADRNGVTSFVEAPAGSKVNMNTVSYRSL